MLSSPRRLAGEPLPEGLVHLLTGHPLQGVDPHQPLNDVPGLVGKVLVDVVEAALPDLIEKVVLVLGPEGVVPLQNHEQEDPQTPQVGVDGHMVPLGDDFGGHVGGGPAEGVDGAGGHRLKAEAEVD